MDTQSVSSQPPQPLATALPCGCIRGERLCERAQALWAKYMDIQRTAFSMDRVDTAWNRYWRHYGASEMYRLTTTEPTIAAVGAVVSTDPLVNASADLRNHELVLTLKLDRTHGRDAFVDIRIGGSKLADLIRFATLAQEPETLMTCWRCDRRGQKEFFVSSHGGDCTVCYMENHCDACSEYLHA